MANIQLKFGTLALDSTNNITISKINWKDSRSIQTSNIPVTDGAIAEEAKLGAKTLIVEGDIAGSGYDALQANIDTLEAGLKSQGLAALTKDDARYIMAQLKDFTFDYVHPTRLAKWTATFVAHFPFWLSETELTDSRVPASDVGYTINNPGNAPARVKFTFTAPGGGISDNLKVENQTTGKSFQYRGNVSGYESLEVDNRYDTDDFEVLNNGVEDHANFEGDFITLNPGDNTIVFIGTENTIVAMAYRATFY